MNNNKTEIYTDNSATAVIILAAGRGTRMKSDIPKVLHQVAGRSLLDMSLDTAMQLKPIRIIIVLPPAMRDKKFETAEVVIQEQALGTGHGVKIAMQELKGFNGKIIILFADTPLIKSATLIKMLDLLNYHAICTLGFYPDIAGDYGRLLCDNNGGLLGIVEAKHASAAEKEIKLCNAGVMAFTSQTANNLLDRIEKNELSGEYYLTDIIALARMSGLVMAVQIADKDEVRGINNRQDLTKVEAIMQGRLRERAMLAGVSFTDPSTVYLSYDTMIEPDVTIAPFVVFGRGVTIASGVNIYSFSHLEGVTIDQGASIGPFARLRPGSVIGSRAKIGNFVEIKNSQIGEGSKVNHLSYLGDAVIGSQVNIGAGTITCNYDGFEKHSTIIEDGAFIGSNTAIVAPLTIGAGSIIAAGSAVDKNVKNDALYINRVPALQKDNWAIRFRNLRRKLLDNNKKR